MSGIVFFKTTKLDELEAFYKDQVKCTIWLRQAECLMLRHGNLILGFHQGDRADTEGVITFFYNTKEAVDRMYQSLRPIAISEPKQNEKYRIYHFFAKDPEARTIEFQHFEHPIESHLMADELLLTRRSVREFLPEPVPQETLDKIFEICRYAPTSVNTQAYYYKIIRDKEILERLSLVREQGGRPIGRAPMAVAICSDPSLSPRPIQDGCIAAYHFILAAWCFGLGTCWIGAMDRDDVKEMLGIPKEHYIATVTPLGYPAEIGKKPPQRHEVSWFVKE
jgi:nitroreductase